MTISDESFHLAHISVEEGASLVLKNCSIIAGARRNLDEGQRSIMHDVGFDVAPGGSLTIDHCKIRHHEYGNGFQIAIGKGATFVMKDSEVYGVGSEWGYGGIRLENEYPVLEGNLIEESIINCFGCGRGSQIERNRILNSYFAINLSQSDNLSIKDNVIKGSIRPAIVGNAGGLIVEGNLIADVWQDGIQLWGGDQHVLENNVLNRIREPGTAINLWGADNHFIRNRVMNSYRGIAVNGGETIIGNILENSRIGLVYDELPTPFVGRLQIESPRPIYAVGIRMEQASGGFQLTGIPADGIIF